MKASQIILSFSLFAILLCASGASLSAFANDEQPNIVFILADDCTYNLFGCYGGEDVPTPHIDSLAAEGLKFNRAYAAAAMCAPFRAELYTGLYPVRNGVAWNHSRCNPGVKSVCHYLSDLGYRVGLSGKKHASPPETFPFVNVAGFPSGDGVRNFMTKDDDQPFCLFLCSHSPHAPWTEGDASQFNADELSLAPSQHDNPPTREVMTRYLAEVNDLDREVGEILDLIDQTQHRDDTLVIFSSEQGWALGFAKWSNWNLGVHTALVARWPGRISPGTETDALVQMADVTPTFIEAALGESELLDLDGTSFLDVLTGESDSHREYVYGVHNNTPEGEPYPIRSIRDDRFHYLLNLTPEASYHEKHVMVADSRLTWWPALKAAEAEGDLRATYLLEKFHNRPEEELYLVDDDPYEMTNLADDPAYAETKQRLRAELEDWIASQNDPGTLLDTPAVHAANKRGESWEDVNVEP
jgi:N-sulfoglucosamine sulfohydrolase